ncbi:hypothetical protein MBLNU230_g1786t1 [Neophaeotheca triangularis]
MQTLWTRLALPRATCKCPSCTSTASAIAARRSGAAASRQTSRYLTSSTLLYSGIFAAAATADAGVKQRRRDQWDRAIADVKRELAQPEQAIEKSQQEVQDEDLVQFSPLRSQETEEDPFRDIYPWRRKPSYPANTGPSLNVHHLPPQSIYADDESKERAELRLWTPAKLERVRLATDILQLNILRALTDNGWEEEAAASVPEGHGDFIRRATRQQRDGVIHDAIRRRHLARRALHKTDVELSQYQGVDEDGFNVSEFEQDDRGDFREIARSLNYHLQELFRQHRSAAITTPTLLGRLSHDLAISTAPPTLETYNTLLRGFSTARQYELTYEVVHALRYTHMRPNELSLSSILNLSTATNNFLLFKRWLRYIEGGSGGLSLARPDVVINDAGKDRLELTEDGKVIQHPHPTPRVLGAIIRGVLRFSGFDAALNKCREMGMKGWGLCVEGLQPLLIDCANRGDWAAGKAVWNQIQVLDEQQQRIDTTDSSTRTTFQMYKAMLKLCVAANKNERSHEIWDQAVQAFPHKSRKLASLLFESCAEWGNWTAARAAWTRTGESDTSRGPNLDPKGYAAMLVLCRQADDLTLFTEVWGQVELSRHGREVGSLLQNPPSKASRSADAEMGGLPSNSLLPYGDVPDFPLAERQTPERRDEETGALSREPAELSDSADHPTRHVPVVDEQPVKAKKRKGRLAVWQPPQEGSDEITPDHGLHSQEI